MGTRSRLTRRPDWEVRLARFLAERRVRPFRWGEHDCLLFAADWIAEATGVVLAPGLRGTYDSAESALRQLHRRCGTLDLAAVATRHLGAPLATPRMARRGDLAAGPTDTGLGFGIVLGPSAAFPGPAGLVAVPLSALRLAWRIG